MPVPQSEPQSPSSGNMPALSLALFIDASALQEVDASQTQFFVGLEISEP